ncbi:hypothetical protein BS50DRAFT_301057 [Corynespora cassiicola Philippines]|uniref:Uncharacterized protein n=1 Tax=Corynespora cassiicola Philippines TaxID=1448308 RepID=A0A2T2NX04_CORCC|nr:hypothetical protein BS50DRAFT_301057 [Corynespora cassiicola Philippines]
MSRNASRGRMRDGWGNSIDYFGRTPSSTAWTVYEIAVCSGRRSARCGEAGRQAALYSVVANEAAALPHFAQVGECWRAPWPWEGSRTEGRDALHAVGSRAQTMQVSPSVARGGRPWW